MGWFASTSEVSEASAGVAQTSGADWGWCVEGLCSSYGVCWSWSSRNGPLLTGLVPGLESLKPLGTGC